MDQAKTGKFIATLRKEKGLTQCMLAKQLGISDKTVSKWERGAGLPEVSLMLPLCRVLSISVNELLTGEKLADTDYKQQAEVTIMNLVQENKENKKHAFQATACGSLTIIAVLALGTVASFVEMPTIYRVLLLVFAFATGAFGIGVTVSIDVQAGYFECPSCNTLFIPTTKEYVKGYHTFTRRRLTCPQCGKAGMCRHRVVR